jgi:hypothetical protein
MVNPEEIIPLQKGQCNVVFCSTAVPRREMLRFNSEWISYRPLQSGIGHLPVAGMSSVQRKDLLHSGHWIFNIGLLREKNDCETPQYVKITTTRIRFQDLIRLQVRFGGREGAGKIPRRLPRDCVRSVRRVSLINKL